MIALSFFLAGVMGVTLGLLGGGGSILTVPILRYVVGFDAKEAIALSLAVVGVTSAIGALRFWRSGHAHFQVALPFGIVSMAGSYAGARVAEHMSGEAQLMIFAVVMLAAAVSMIRKRGADAPAPEDTRPSYRWTEIALIAAFGLAVGILTGIVGIGGGFMILPALVLFVKLPMRNATGTSLVIIAMNAVAGLLGYTGHIEIPWAFLSAFTAMSIVGILIGSYLVHRIAPGTLRRGFAVMLIVMGAMILYNNRAALAGRAGIGVGERPGAVSTISETADRMPEPGPAMRPRP